MGASVLWALDRMCLLSTLRAEILVVPVLLRLLSSFAAFASNKLELALLLALLLLLSLTLFGEPLAIELVLKNDNFADVSFLCCCCCLDIVAFSLFVDTMVALLLSTVKWLLVLCMFCTCPLCLRLASGVS